MTALNSEELSHLRLPTSTTAAVVSGTTGASFLTTTLHFTTPAPGFNSPQSNIHAGTSGGYDEGKPSQQGSSQDSIIRATNAATIAWMPLTSQPSSSTVYTHSDPLSGLSWSYRTPSSSVSSGQFTLCFTFQKFAVKITFFYAIPTVIASSSASLPSIILPVHLKDPSHLQLPSPATAAATSRTMTFSFPPLTSLSVTPTQSSSKRTHSQNERRATERVTLELQSRIDLNRLEQSLVFFHGYSYDSGDDRRCSSVQKVRFLEWATLCFHDPIPYLRVARASLSNLTFAVCLACNYTKYLLQQSTNMSQ